MNMQYSLGDQYVNHRLNMELDLQSLFGLNVVHSCTHWLGPRYPLTPPPPLHLGSSNIRGR
jgi:hypothetical protein